MRRDDDATRDSDFDICESVIGLSPRHLSKLPLNGLNPEIRKINDASHEQQQTNWLDVVWVYLPVQNKPDPPFCL